MDETVAARLRALGPGFNLPEVQALYAPLLAQQPREGVLLQADLAYGPHPRQRLDVYAPAAPGRGRPVLVWWHGGGFIRGDKAQRANIGWWGAREGFVVVLPNYRLAPESRWPSGPQDVAAVLPWLHDQVGAFGGDARHTVLAGESAGAAHVAAATLLRRFGVNRSTGLCGAVLASGPYNARLERLARSAFGTPTPDPRNDAYFGTDDADTLAEFSLVDQVDAAPFPLLISMAERDLLQMQVQAGELFARLVTQHGFQPELRLLREHNHFSGGHSIGTADTSVSGPLADFVRRCAGEGGRAGG